MKAWWASFLEHMPPNLPRPAGVRIMDFHDHVTVNFDNVDDAIRFHEGAEDLGVKFTRRDGSESSAEPFRPKPPHVKRRGSALHPVCTLLYDNKVLVADEAIKRVHRERGASPFTLYYALHKDTEHIRQLATVCWEDSGAKVTIKDIIPSRASQRRCRRR